MCLSWSYKSIASDYQIDIEELMESSETVALVEEYGHKVLDNVKFHDCNSISLANVVSGIKGTNDNDVISLGVKNHGHINIILSRAFIFISKYKPNESALSVSKNCQDVLKKYGVQNNKYRAILYFEYVHERVANKRVYQLPKDIKFSGLVIDNELTSYYNEKYNKKSQWVLEEDFLNYLRKVE